MAQDNKTKTNSLGMEMISIAPGEFLMGEGSATPPSLGGPELLACGDWDERPLHKVALTYPFLMSRDKVTVEQYRKFRPDFPCEGRYAVGISWHEAMEFCDWLACEEGKPYRLPTEAEWEYVCRAGTKSLFSSGDAPPSPDAPNAWGLVNMHSRPPEWVYDWHGQYDDGEQIDPIGPESGFVKVVRGAGVQFDAPYYSRSANRGGLPPNFPPPLPAGKDSASEGRCVGFRVVQAALPATKPTSRKVPFVQMCVPQRQPAVRQGPDPSKPYYRRRPLLPIPPENQQAPWGELVGLHPAILAHNHSPALAVCPNGDVLAVHFSACGTWCEYWSNLAFIATRLRFGADQWDMPDFLFDFPDVTEESPLLWNDGGRLVLFTGGVGLDGVPFKWITSADSGARWSEVKFPIFAGPIGPHWAQPITSAFHRPDGTIYVASDGEGGTSLLWASRDDGKTWLDSGGRTAGRHSAFILLKDGSILAIGGKNTDIDGYMPQAVSRDGGRMWQASKTIFPALTGNQRPTAVRLASGRIFFASDFQNKQGSQPSGFTGGHGSFVALSDDEGATWHVKPLSDALPHEGNVINSTYPRWGRAGHSYGTLGYAVATQAPNGVIHLISSMNHPSLHFEMNEAWILDKDAPCYTAPASQQFVADRTELHEAYPSGAIKAIRSGGVGPDGRWLLDGEENWFYESGARQWQVTWLAGRKVGAETFWSPDGKIAWAWEYREDGSSTWMQYWPNGRERSESTWIDGRCQGVASLRDSSGKVISRKTFKDGFAVD